MIKAVSGRTAARVRSRDERGHAPVRRAGETGCGNSDEALLAGIRQGDPNALAMLFGRHGDALYRYLYGLMGRREVAEDLLQDTFLRLWRFGPRLPLDVHMSYVYRIAMNVARDEIRHRSERPGLSDEVGLQGPMAVSTFEDEVAMGDMVTRALSVLTPDQRLTVGLHYFADQPVEAVARITGVPVGTVKSRLHRAYRRLAERLQEMEGGHERER